MVDYSKFEKIVISDDEDESDDRGDPGVYRVGDGESFTVPGRNVTITSNKPRHDNVLVKPIFMFGVGLILYPGCVQHYETKLYLHFAYESLAIISEAVWTLQQSSSPSQPSKAAKAIKSVIDTTYGALEKDYFWSQSKDSVTLGVFVATGTKYVGFSDKIDVFVSAHEQMWYSPVLMFFEWCESSVGQRIYNLL